MDRTTVPLPRRALVAGGTGLVGSKLLGQLSVDQRYSQVITLTRRPVASAAKVETRVVAFDNLEGCDCSPVDDAFCCLGTTRRDAGSAETFRRVDFDYIVAYARMAKRSGARRFLLVSSIGANANSSLLYPQVKGQTEAAVRALDFAVVGIVRPSFLVGHRATRRAGEAAMIAITNLISPILAGPLRPYRPVRAEAVANALVQLAFAGRDGTTIIESADITPAPAQGL